MIVLFLGALLFALPFIPTLLEILHPSDDKATPISRFQLQDVRNTTQDFFSILDLLLLNEKWLVHDAPSLLPIENSPLRGIHALQDLEIYPGAHTLTVAAEKSIVCQPGSQVYEAHAREKITLRNKSEIMWWATAPIIEMSTETHQRGKLEAHDLLTVQGRCYFSSLKSKNIRIGDFVQTNPPAKMQASEGRHVYFKMWQNTDKSLTGDHIIESHARLTANTTIRGGLKVAGNLYLERGCKIEGHVFVGGNLHSEGDTQISGVVIVERNIFMGPGHEICREDATGTVSGDEVRIEGPQLIHGTLRCWEQGQIICSYKEENPSLSFDKS